MRLRGVAAAGRLMAINRPPLCDGLSGRLNRRTRAALPSMQAAIEFSECTIDALAAGCPLPACRPASQQCLMPKPKLDSTISRPHGANLNDGMRTYKGGLSVYRFRLGSVTIGAASTHSYSLARKEHGTGTYTLILVASQPRHCSQRHRNRCFVRTRSVLMTLLSALEIGNYSRRLITLLCTAPSVAVHQSPNPPCTRSQTSWQRTHHGPHFPWQCSKSTPLCASDGLSSPTHTRVTMIVFASTLTYSYREMLLLLNVYSTRLVITIAGWSM
jgi:hypothetical protein